MEILTKTEFRLRLDEFLEKISNGAVFIYPTDTIYGIGCNALNKRSVARIRELKRRETNPFSVWAPSKEWIKDNCILDKDGKEAVDLLPGPLTLVLELKKKISIADNVALGIKTLGVRIPNHWFSKVVEQLGIPLVTTSANKMGRKFMTSVEDLDPDIKEDVKFMIYEGPKEGRPSKIINLVEGVVKER